MEVIDWLTKNIFKKKRINIGFAKFIVFFNNFLRTFPLLKLIPAKKII